MYDLDISALKQNTVQIVADAQQNGGLELLSLMSRGPLLAPWGTRQRERELRNVYRHDYNWMVQGAFAGILSVIATTPWEISGPDDISTTEAKFWRSQYKAARLGSDTQTDRPDIEYWQALLRQADFGRGWGSFVKKGVDYLRQDGGWYWELIAPGNPIKPPSGPITGLAYLDGLRCTPTGDPEYPVIYYDKNGGYHLLHHTRVVQICDMPDGDEQHPGYGLCALSRAIAISYREVLMGRYVEQKLDDKPAPGIVVASGINKKERDAALASYRMDQNADERPPWGRQLWFHSMDAGVQASITTQSFSVAPESWSFNEYTLIDVDALALAIGVDRQDLWQLTGGNLGSATQSQVLAQKSRGKTIGNLRTELERTINDILPEEYEFAFKYRDSQEDEERARIAQTWASVVSSLGSNISSDEARQMLANQVEAIKDAITDENGQIRRVNDADVTPPEQEIVDDAAPEDQAATPQEESQPPPPVKKAIQSTRLMFETDFADLINGVLSGAVNRVRFGIVARDMLRRYGRDAFLDGLSDGGIETPEMDEDDSAIYSAWLADQSGYVSDFGDTLKGKPDIDATERAVMWYNKSIEPMHQAGLVSADRNGLYEWVLGQTEEHCTTCLRMNGQMHRMKDYTRKGILPKSEVLECKGYLCDCKLVRTTGRARGRF